MHRSRWLPRSLRPERGIGSVATSIRSVRRAAWILLIGRRAAHSLSWRVALSGSLLVWACSGDLAAQAGWYPWNFPPGASTPSGQPATFTPIEVFPRPGDPGYNSTSICPRVSGLFGFVDPFGPSNPNDDREYVVAGRSDGVFLIDVTPANTVIPTGIPATNLVHFLAEPNPQPEPGLAILNGAPPTYPAYCLPNPPFTTSPYAWTTADTTNREVAVYQVDADTFVIYAVNSRRDGIWVIPVVRETAGPNAGFLKIATTAPAGWANTGWNTQIFAVGGQIPVGRGHHITIDQASAQLFVTSESTGSLHVFSIPSWDPGNLGTALLDYGVAGTSVHQTMVQDGKLYVSVWGDLTLLNPVPPRIDVFTLPITPSSTPLISYSSTYAKNGHSCYIDETPNPQPDLWIVAEDANSIGSRQNIDRIAIDDTGGASVEHIPWLGRAGVQYAQGTEPSLVHNLRGVGRTGFLAHYTDGISVVDLTTNPISVLATFDITGATHPSPYTSWPVGPGLGPNSFPSGNEWALYVVLDNYRGAWDVNPYQDSGLVKVAGGEKGMIVFRVDHGHLNRYWDCTPFPGPGSPTPSASPGVFPRIVTPYGPARANGSLMILDANKDQLATVNSMGQPVRYRWWLAYWRLPTPPVAPTNPWTHNGVTRPVSFNLDPTQPFVFVPNAAYGNDLFVFPNIGAVGDPYYAQMFVEEEVQDPQGQWSSTGAWSASRGTWIGVLP